MTLDLAGVAPIPATATGVVGNLIAITPNYTGYLRAAPSGSPLDRDGAQLRPGTQHRQRVHGRARTGRRHASRFWHGRQHAPPRRRHHRLPDPGGAGQSVTVSPAFA